MKYNDEVSCDYIPHDSKLMPQLQLDDFDLL